ncbi:unnamed protein product [Phaedon cochleariae]|uniref:DNA 3'-5' helicase n=1 Tax=Phaedon cochleariae TaxID=80249 RepID=A0A9P0GIU6_PHACE|nr:unnamed protein product [Phaedon cochleariae]
MDLLEDPEIKETYDKCKYIVKVWEHKFVKKHKRIPSKLDIKDASREVRNAYRKYFQLKTAALEQSFMDVDGFDDEDDVKNEELSSNDKIGYIPGAIEENESTHTFNLTEEIPDIPNKSTLNANKLEEDKSKEVISEVWGAHLNNKKNEVKEKQSEQSKTNTNLNITKKLFCGSKFSKRNPRKSLSFSQKNKSETTFNQVSLSQPNPTTAFESEEAISLSQSDIFSENSINFSTYSETVNSQQVNIVHSVLENNHRPLKSIDSGWLERIIQETGISRENPDLPLPQNLSEASISKENVDTEATKLDYDSEDIIEESDEDCSFDSRSLHIAKKRKVDNSLVHSEILSNCASEHVLDQKATVETDYQEQGKIENAIFNEHEHDNNKMYEHDISESEAKQSSCDIEHNKSKNDESHSDSENSENKIKQLENPEKCDKGIEKKRKTAVSNPRRNAKSPKRKAKKPPSKRNTSQKNTKVETAPIEDISPRRSSRKTRVKVSLQEFPSEEEDAFHTDTDEKDPEFNLDNEKKKKIQTCSSDEEPEKHTEVITKTKKRKEKSNTSTLNKSNQKKLEDSNCETEEKKPYELEFSIKPRIVAPRYSSLKKIITQTKLSSEVPIPKSDKPEPSLIKDKRQQAKENLENKIATGRLNDNFVRIDIKKKKFVRGKTTKSFSKFKKAQWRSNKAKALSGPEMDMGGCDGGMLTCFNCGQTGHFASRCPNEKGDGLLPLNTEAEEECPFPTLEEASQMAVESNLIVRVPKVVLKETQNGVENSKNGSGDERDDDGLMNEFEGQLVLEALRLEEYVKKLDVNMYMDNVKTVEPYFKLEEDGSIMKTPPIVYETLKKFGHDSFRPGQEQAIMRILSGKSTLVTLSTGSGKSLCYQLPAHLYSLRRPCIALIVSPLVSLMDDQITGVARFLKAGCLHSNQTKAQRQKILEAVSAGELSVLLVSPEAVVAGEKQSGFGSFLRKLPPIAFACIDEAHCVSQWSHNFRPSYLMICRVLRESLGVSTILGLTATATRATRASIIQHLQIPDGEAGVISDTPLPDNLALSVSKDANRDHALLGLLTSEPFSAWHSIIVYCTRREECERVAAFLRTTLKSELPETKKRKRMSGQAEPYHAGMAASRRKSVQNAFMAGEVRIVVATVAFGMGINKADIRAVIHFNMPSSFESYVQEVGRAGRDGLPSQCHVFLHPQGADGNELRRHIHANSIDRHAIRKLLQKIFVPCSCKTACPKHEVAFSIADTVRSLDIPEENVSTLLCYLELHENKYIELLSPAYTWCKVISYGGPMEIRKMAKECPPLAMALALHKTKEGEDQNVLEFPVVDVAAAMGWESGICKHKLKNLEWTTVNNQPKRSKITVQLSDLGFHLFAPGNLSDDQLDEALDNLYSRVVDQEQKALFQLKAIHQTLQHAAKPTFRMTLSEDKDNAIKLKVREYFDSPDPLKMVEVEAPAQFNEEQLVCDVHALVSMYKDNSFTGRAVARIFHGIQSPNYPAVVWGRCKFWRRHLDKDFHAVVRIATREIIKLR